MAWSDKARQAAKLARSQGVKMTSLSGSGGRTLIAPHTITRRGAAKSIMRRPPKTSIVTVQVKDLVVPNSDKNLRPYSKRCVMAPCPRAGLDVLGIVIPPQGVF